MQSQKIIQILCFFELESEKDIELDISLVHPWSLDIAKQSGQVDGYAALREKRKKWKNSNRKLY